ncbi:chain length determinant protein EpsF [Massilia sp. TWP1-3-3]|uniref:chain length determinant protein EpsF n=1 Tax=Massilia sp. TWP1-3-3 TaxID=2804573 RepID=UPI003CF06760
MKLFQFLLILLARRRIIFATVLVTVALTFLVSVLLPKSYNATASVLLNYKGMDTLTGIVIPSQLLPGYMATQIDIISSKNVAGRVVDRLKLASSPEVLERFRASTGGEGSVRDWLADLLLKNLDVVPSRESSVVEINFRGSDPRFAAGIANAFADEYQKLSVELKAEPMKKAAAYFNEQTRLLRDNVEAAQSRLSKYQQERGIVSIDSRVDVELNRLGDLSAQLVAAQAQAMEAASRQGMALGERAAESPDVAASPVVQNLKVQLASAETRLAEVGARLGSNHPQYRSVRAEVDKIRTLLGAQLASASNSVSNNAQILKQRAGALRAALEAQKTRVLELNRNHDELGVLVKDVESAQRAFDAAAQRFSQTKIEGQSEQSDISVLNPATAPSGAAAPRVMLNTMVALFLGAMLGLAFALLAEMLDRRVRSDADVVDVLQVPVFGVIDWRAPTPARRNPMLAMLPRRLRLN